jgi:hypothetical protein
VSENKAKFVEPMLLLRKEKLPEGAEWIHELKLDGYRAIAVKAAGKVHDSEVTCGPEVVFLSISLRAIDPNFCWDSHRRAGLKTNSDSGGKTNSFRPIPACAEIVEQVRPLTTGWAVAFASPKESMYPPDC